MSVCNGETYLDQAIESILTQGFTDFEFIIVDDGSTDRTSTILAAYCARDSRVAVFSRNNQGQASALNFACRQAKGKYVLNLDADDVALPGRIEKQLAFMEKNPETALLGTASRLVWADGRTIRERIPPADDASIRRELVIRASICHTSIAMRKDVFLAAGGYRAPFKCGQDYDLFLRIAEHGKLANLEEVLVLHRIHGNQKSSLRFEQAVLAGMAAQLAAKLRAENKSETPLLEEGDPLSRETLRKFGVTDEEMDKTILLVLQSHLSLALSPERPAESAHHAAAFIARVREFCRECNQEALFSGKFPLVTGVLNLDVSAAAAS
jgi:GT2 family glycosyltransferase